VNELVQRLAAAVRARGFPQVRDVVPALGGMALHFDSGFEGDVLATASAILEEVAKKRLPAAHDVGREVEVPVCFDREFALDLDELAERTRLKSEEIEKAFCAARYRVLMIGFAPGHAYLGGLPEKLAVPRRALPRAVVPAGSVAIANRQAVVYPFAISGGWSVIGRTPLELFDASRSRPSFFGPGDRVRFQAVGREDFELLKQKQ
jgi:KipI family sensor histidine kinase inhibitor